MAEQQQIDELNQKMASARGKLLDALESLGEERAAAPLKEGEWTAKQQMSHLCEMESAYRAWVQKALAEDNPDLTGIPGEPVAIPLEGANLHPASEHLAEMRRQRELTLTVMADMRAEDYDRTATSPIFGTLNVMQWLRSYYRHDGMHNDQVRGAEPAFKPRYSSGKEPDQRRPSASA